jgi:hypothetical protein
MNITGNINLSTKLCQWRLGSSQLRITGKYSRLSSSWNRLVSRQFLLTPDESCGPLHTGVATVVGTLAVEVSGGLMAIPTRTASPTPLNTV